MRRIADEIIASQRREIAEMQYLIDQLQTEGGQIDVPHEAAAQPRVVPAREAITTANTAMIDLEELDEAGIERVLSRGVRCNFSYSRDAGPVLAVSLPIDARGVGKGVVKLHGLLVEATARHTAATPSSASGVTCPPRACRWWSSLRQMALEPPTTAPSAKPTRTCTWMRA